MFRYRICYSKTGPARYLSHLDLIRAFTRSARRAGLPVAYSHGFNPHPRIVFAAPLPVGIAGESEFADLEMEREFAPGELRDALNLCLPQGITLSGVRAADEKEKPLMARVTGAHYSCRGFLPAEMNKRELDEIIQRVMNKDEILISRPGKKNTRTLDLRPGIHGLTGETGASGVQLWMNLQAGVRPQEVLRALREAGLPAEIEDFTIVRHELHAQEPLW